MCKEKFFLSFFFAVMLYVFEGCQQSSFVIFGPSPFPVRCLVSAAGAGHIGALMVGEARCNNSSEYLLRFSSLWVKLPVEPASLSSYSPDLDAFYSPSADLSKHFKHISSVFFQNILYFWFLHFSFAFQNTFIHFICRYYVCYLFDGLRDCK